MNSSNSKEVEETKKCSECLSDIPKGARKCVKCGSKQRTKLSPLVIVILIFGFLGPVVVMNISGDSSSTSTYTPPVQRSTFELGTYKVQSEEFAYTSAKQVNLWKSYSERKKMGYISEGDIIEVTKHDANNDYCKIKTSSVTGWAACGWLVKVK